MLTIKEILVKHRKEKKLTLNEVAAKTGLSTVTLSKYENGWVLPTIENLYKLSKVYEFDYSEMCKLLAKEKESRKG